MVLNSLNSYGQSFQLKIISSLLTHKTFLVNIYDSLVAEDFTNQAHQWIITKIIEYYNKYHSSPDMDFLKLEMKKLENEVLQISVKEQLREAYKASEEDLEYVKEEFSTFCKNQQLKKALLNSIDLIKIGDYDAIRSEIESAMKAGSDKNIGHEYEKDIESRYRENTRKCIPTPWPEINELTQGGLGGGDFGLCFGNPGGGKSWLLVALGSFAVELGFTVVHYTLELSEDYVGKRYDALFTQIAVDQVGNNKDKVEEAISGLKGHLIIKEYSPKRASIYTIENHLKKLISLGTNPDLVIIDYVDLLSSKKKSYDRKEEVDGIYIGTKSLARTMNLPIWSVSQVNRAGANNDIIEGTNASASYDKLFITDFCMSLSRKRQDKVEGTGRIHIMKNRYGGDGMTYSAKVDTSMGNIKILGLYDDDYEEQENKPFKNKQNNTLKSDDKKLLWNKLNEMESIK